MGIPSIAFSHSNFRSPDFTDGARFARQIAAKILRGLAPRVPKRRPASWGPNEEPRSALV